MPGDTPRPQLPPHPTKEDLEKASQDIGIMLKTAPVQHYQLGELRGEAKKRKAYERCRTQKWNSTICVRYSGIYPLMG
ncbi:hypothetical protein PGQ11_014487 [Apiospora arundinis]|uniref:Uncharacterized protein n=1 Tax=Apiospora arundinis TaxID=335852 RepID=A0ABR2HSY2_9PEZI